MRGWLACLCLMTAGCLQIGTDVGDDAGTASGSSGTTAATSPTSDAAVTGASCGLDPTGSVMLCEFLSACPTLGIDPSAYANCGFRVGTSVPIDLECVCSNALCPIGVATSCDDAAQLLAAQDALTVCQQVNEGRCLPLTAADGGSSASGSSAGSGSCTAECQSECAGVPDCLQACGC